MAPTGQHIIRAVLNPVEEDTEGGIIDPAVGNLQKSNKIKIAIYSKRVNNKYNILKSWLGHIKYDEKYMPDLFLTPPEHQHKQINMFLTAFLNTTTAKNENGVISKILK